MNKNTSKVLLFLIVLLVASLSVGCGSSTPNIEGLWEADFRDGAYLRFAPQLKFFAYDNSEKAENNDHFVSGEYRFFEQNGEKCFGFGFFEDASNTPTLFSGILEFASEDHIILTLDEKCEFAGSKVWDLDVDVEKVNIRRIE